MCRDVKKTLLFLLAPFWASVFEIKNRKLGLCGIKTETKQYEKVGQKKNTLMLGLKVHFWPGKQQLEMNSSSSFEPTRRRRTENTQKSLNLNLYSSNWANSKSCDTINIFLALVQRGGAFTLDLTSKALISWLFLQPDKHQIDLNYLL